MHAAWPGGERYYQLTHDYLVHSLREWLTRKQRETRRGRAELVLSERAAIWSAKPELRHLPNLMEWASIRWHTRPKEWSEPQARMMRRAGWFNAVRAILLSGVAAVLAVVGVNVWDYGLAVDSVNDLLLAETHSVEHCCGRSRITAAGLIRSFVRS